MSDVKHRQAVHRSANVRRDAWDRRGRFDASAKPVAEVDTDGRLDGESRVVRRTAAWDLPEQLLPPENFGMRSKGDIRGTSSPTLPGFPVVLHERGGSGGTPELVYRFKDVDGRERIVPERRAAPAGQSISYASLLALGQDSDWEMGYLATIALCRMLVKERFTGRLELDAVGLDSHGKVVWLKSSDDAGDNGVSVSYVKELNTADLVWSVGSIFYRFVTGSLPVAEGLMPASQLNEHAPAWVDTICNAALGDVRCGSVPEFLDVLHQHLTDEQREQVTSRLAEWALRTRRLSQHTEDAVAVQLGAALSHLGFAAAQRGRRRSVWLPVGILMAALLGAAVVALRHFPLH